MKANFVVSAERGIWIPQARKLFACDPYIAHVLEKTGDLDSFDEVKIAPVAKNSREDFVRDHAFVDQKVRLYLPILIGRLEQIHDSRFGEKFWRKALALSLLRHVSLCYELFSICEQYLDPERHDCQILDQACFLVPQDFDEHRKTFQCTELGQEQLFSVYCSQFHPGVFAPCRVKSGSIAEVPAQTVVRPRSIWRKVTIKSILRRLLRYRSPTMGIMNSYFSLENRDKLLFTSKGLIQAVPLPTTKIGTDPLRWKDRETLASPLPDFDRFDRFAFACLLHGMPRNLVEDFEQTYTELNGYFDGFRSLNWIVCEGWIGHSLSAFALAVLGLRGVHHLYNEHNYLAHPFVGNNLKYIFPLVDEFTTLGWSDPAQPNLVPGASLFNWVENSQICHEHQILFISSVPNTRAPEINSSYGESGARVVPDYLNMNKQFFGALSDSTLSSMVYRAYPARYARHALIWDQTYFLDRFIARVKIYDDSIVPARVLMQKSRLVVINYLSTSYLEALQANRPTVILWNRSAYHLEDRYSDFWDQLIEAGICQTDAVSAAEFVENIKENPEKWWESDKVQRARKAFLATNIGSPEVMLKHLVDRACSSS
ncbi:MAG: LIC12162 family protein [Gammaproteobacteria bacterium]|jgi:putative transferase (TIGR04331 family)